MERAVQLNVGYCSPIAADSTGCVDGWMLAILPVLDRDLFSASLVALPA